MADATKAENPVTLGQIAKEGGGKLSGDERLEVNDITHDSRQAKQGSLFVAIRGELFDAHKFVPHVIEQGAVGILSELERPAELQSATGLAAAAWIQVEDIRRAMAVAAAAIHHHPS